MTAACFKSLLIGISPNKNAEWTNDNQQCFVNYTSDAIKGLDEQSDTSSLIAWQTTTPGYDSC